MNSACSSRPVSGSPIATTDAVGWPSATSRARFGPVSTPVRSVRCSGRTSATTSVMRSSVPCSTPFERLTIGVSGAMWGRASSRTVRMPCDGIPSTTTSAPANASSIDPVARRPAVSSMPARYSGFSWRASMHSARSGLRAQSTVSAFVAAIAATAVPHDPAPATTTFTTRSASPGAAPRSAERAPPAVVLALRHLRVPLAGPGDLHADRRHDPVGRGADVVVGADGDGFTDHRHLGDAALPVRLATLEQQPVRAPHAHGRDRDPARPGQAGRPRLALHRLEIERDRALGEDGDALASVERGDRGIERAGRVGRAA